MRILEIRLTNLNSLRGDHLIDLDGGPLGRAGIFAITGPTGAGKSTILDAITLALYGRAARYGNVANPEHMMSRHSGACSASVVFEVAKGKYRAEWQLRRSRGKASGNIQPAKRYVYDIDGNVLADQIKAVDALLEELVGLDYDRFMRSVLLAQGEFARFLKAKANERAELLESLTGTTIFSQLGALTWKEAQDRASELEARRSHVGSIELLSDEQRAHCQMRLEQQSAQQSVSQKNLEELIRRLNNAETLKSLLEQEASVSRDIQLVLQHKGSLADDLRVLHRHQLAAPFFPLLQSLDDADRAQQQATTGCRESEETLKRVRTQQCRQVQAAVQMAERMKSEQEHQVSEGRQRSTQLTKEIKAAERWLRDHQSDQNLSRELPSLVEGLNELRNIRRELAELIEDSSTLHRELSDQNIRLGELQKAADGSRHSLKARTEYRQRLEQQFSVLEKEENSVDVARRVEAANERLRELRQLEELTGQMASKKARYDASMLRWREFAELLKQVLRDENAQVEEHGQLLTFQAAVSEHLRTAEIVAGLEVHRSMLREGEPCPLCGSPYHGTHAPDAAENDVERIRAKLKETIRQAELMAKRIEALRTDRIRIERDSVAEQTRCEELAVALQGDEARIVTISGQTGLTEMTADALREAQESTRLNLQCLNERLTVLEAARRELKTAEDAEFESEREVTRAEDALQSCRSEIQRRHDRMSILEDRIEKQNARLAEQEKRVASLLEPFRMSVPEEGAEEKSRQSLETRRRNYDDRLEMQKRLELSLRDANEQLGGFQEGLTQTEAACLALKQRTVSLADSEPVADSSPDVIRWPSLKAAEDALNHLDTEIASAETRHVERLQTLTTCRAGRNQVERELRERLQDSEFRTIEELRDARIDEARVRSIERFQKQLEGELQTLNGRLGEIRHQTGGLRSRGVAEGEELEVLKRSKFSDEIALQNLIGEIATLRDELRRDDESRRRIQDMNDALEQEAETLRIWEKLAGLIGSSDGSRFRRFAQGISLDILIRHANRHLNSLTDRYQLRRIDETELELEILDLYQAGATRPMSSLSGGESFLASLALALGLSDLAGRNVRINSLFIDEGFGSLDPETLDIALSALEVLRLENKTIGIISHVHLLKERISTQINLIRQPGGISHLQVTSD